MSVAVPVIDSFDGELRRIYLKEGVTTFHWIDDIYKEYRNWRRVDESSRKWLPFLKASGNEPKGGGKYTPRYVTMLDGARIVPYDENILIVVTGEAITDNADIDPDPFDTTTRTEPLKLYITPPASELVRAEAEIAAVNRMSYNEQVYVDVINGVSGTDGLKGNQEFPVNNVTDALTIAVRLGIKQLMFLESIHLTGDYNLNKYILKGRSHVLIDIEIDPIAQVFGSVLSDATITGTLDGGNELINCIVNGIHYFNGHIHNCGLIGTIYLEGGDDAVISDCKTIDPYNPPIIDMGSSGQNLVMPNYSGLITIKNLDGFNFVGIGLNAGQATLDSTSVVSGTIHISGNGTLVDENGNHISSGLWNDGVTITNEAISKEVVGESVWDVEIQNHLIPGTTGRSVGVAQFGGYVYIDAINGQAGTAFPLGTANHPVNNLTDAVSIATSNGIQNIHIFGNYTFVNGTYISNFKFYGDSMIKSLFTFEAGCIVAYCEFYSAKITGDLTGIIGATECHILNLGSVGLVPSAQPMIIQNSIIEGTLTIPANYSGAVTVISCWSKLDSSGNAPVFNMGGAAFSLSCTEFSGAIDIINSGAGSSVDLVSGGSIVYLNNTNTGGTFVFNGIGVLIDESTGTAIDNNMLTQSSTGGVGDVLDDLAIMNEGLKKISKFIPYNSDL